MKRKMLIMLFCLFLVPSLMMFAGGEQETEMETETEVTGDPWRQFEGEKVTMLVVNQPYTQGIKELLPEFKEKTGITVDMEMVGWPSIYQKVGVELASGSDIYDLVFTEADKIPRFANWLEPLDAYLEDDALADSSYLQLDDYIQSTVDAFTYQGELYALPIFSATVMMYFRKDVFEEHGITAPPETFDELVEVAKTIDSSEMPAIALRGRPGASFNVWHWSMFLYGMGGNFFKDFPDDMTPILDQPEAIRALEIYSNLMQNYSIPGAGSASYDDVVIAMQQGNVGMVLEGAPLGGRILDPSQSKVVGKVGFHLIPKGPAGRFPPFTAHGFVINKASENKKAAFLFLQWAMSKDVLKKVALNQNYVAVTRNSLWEDPDFKEKYGFEYGAGSYLQTYQETLKVAPPWYRPAFEEWPQVGDRVGIAIQEAIVKQKTPAQALKDANEDIIIILEKAGLY